MGRHGTIAGRKESQDKRRAALFTKYAKAITVAARNGGDPEYNAGLKLAIDRAKGINMPNDNINRAIKKGTGELGGADYEELIFEGYGASGVAVIVETLTDNRNRTTASVRSAFDKYGGNLGTPGCVSYMFNQKGVITLEKTDDIDEDEVMEVALEAGMEDMQVYDDSIEILTAVEDFSTVADAIREAGYEPVEADIEYVPDVEAEPKSDEDKAHLKKMIDVLEDNEDVQKVHHNCSVDLEA